MAAPIDLVIHHGQVADVANGVLLKQDVAIGGDRIVAVGRPGSFAASEVLDATDCVVSPGFVDIHSHSDTFPLIDPSAQSKLCDGVTTEITGNCGFSPFPLRGEDRRQEQEQSDRYGLRIDWTGADEFFERAQRVGTAINRAYLLGHGTLRGAVMGHQDREPSEEELEEMRRELVRAMEAGAIGLSSGLIYAPGCFAKSAELAALCRTVAEMGGFYSTHMRSEGDALEAAVDEALTVARESGVRLQISHLKTAGEPNWTKIAWLKERLFRAQSDGLDFACDRYPYIAGSTGLHFLIPQWAKDGGPTAELGRLADATMRRKMAEEMLAAHRDPASWQRVVVSCVASEANKGHEGRSVAQIAQAMGKDPVTAVFDLLVSEQLNVDAIVFGMSEGNLREILIWPFVAIGSDASFRCPTGPLSAGKPHPRAYGTFSRVLCRYVRQEHLLTPMEALRKMTLLPAQRAKLEKRGQIRQGWFADLVVFDPRAVEDRATYEQPHQPSRGIKHVLVNGRIALRDGVTSGGLHGRVLRRE